MPKNVQKLQEESLREWGTPMIDVGARGQTGEVGGAVDV